MGDRTESSLLFLRSLHSKIDAAREDGRLRVKAGTLEDVYAQIQILLLRIDDQDARERAKQAF